MVLVTVRSGVVRRETITAMMTAAMARAMTMRIVRLEKANILRERSRAAAGPEDLTLGRRAWMLLEDGLADLRVAITIFYHKRNDL